MRNTYPDVLVKNHSRVGHEGALSVTNSSSFDFSMEYFSAVSYCCTAAPHTAPRGSRMIRENFEKCSLIYPPFVAKREDGGSETEVTESWIVSFESRRCPLQAIGSCFPIFSLLTGETSQKSLKERVLSNTRGYRILGTI